MRFIILTLTCVFLTCHCEPHESEETETHHGKYEGKVHDEGISDEDHYKHDASHEHNKDYDHEAFLGKDEAHLYDEKTPEQSKEALGHLFSKVDVDNDGQVTKDEMTKWIHLRQNENIKKDSDKQMIRDDGNGDGFVTFDEYKKNAYGFLDKNGVPKKDASQKDYHRYDPQFTTKEPYAKMLAQEERRFKEADVDGDKKLKADEYAAFTHPETHEHMKDVVTKEALEDMDKNNDGHIDVDEYISEYWPAEERAKDPKEPDWVKEEKKTFLDHHDKNKDGKLDESEVKVYMFPPEDSRVVQEANHLVAESDNDGDGKISHDEMVEHYETFVGSHATNFGDLLRDHEDL